MDAFNWQKEKFSKAYLLAVATQGGYTLGQWNLDKDGVDATVRSGGIDVDFQLKCTASPNILKDGDYTFDLDIATYEKLRHPHRSAPGYLLLVVVPRDLEKWMAYQSEHVLMFCHGYWARIQDSPAPKVRKPQLLNFRVSSSWTRPHSRQCLKRPWNVSSAALEVKPHDRSRASYGNS